MLGNSTERRARLLILAAIVLVGHVALPAGEDCNDNGVPDDVDIAEGTSADCNGNTVPDECDVEPRFPREIIATGLEASVSVVVIGADLDGDGDPDAVSGSVFDGKIAWYENVGGTSFGPQQVIAIMTDYPNSLFAADVDGDADLDLLFASGSKVAWLENLDGLGNFGPQRFISPRTQGAAGGVAVFGGDIDRDGDFDVMAGFNRYDDAISWYENLDGTGNFGDERLITQSVEHPRFVLGADIDGDGDLDMVSASRGLIAWSENTDGAGDFGTLRTISVQASGAYHVAVADLDGDGDNDVLSASSLDNKIAWYENLDGEGQFGPQQVLGLSTLARGVTSTDIDNDSDLDVVFIAFSQGKVGWFENLDGAGSFGPLKTIFDAGTRGEFVCAVDVDGDGDTDLLTGGDEVAWHRNDSNDCNGNRVPDACDPDCNANHIPDSCDVARGARDCNGNLMPDLCETDCIFCDGDSDQCPDDLDCLPSDPSFWSLPGAAGNLRVEPAAGFTRVTWDAPSFTGGLSVHFDTLRSSLPGDFQSPADCLESDGTDRTSRDFDDPPPPGELIYYLIRVENDCPGPGAMGTDSAGLPRRGRACP